MKPPKEKRCTLSDKELIEKSNKIISETSKTYGKAWKMSIPVNFNDDSDMVLSELVRRYEVQTSENAQIREALDVCKSLLMLIHTELVLSKIHLKNRDSIPQYIEKIEQILKTKENETD